MEAIEENGGASLANWRSATSTHRQVAAVVAAVYEDDFEDVRKLPLSQLARYVTVSIAGDDDPKAKPAPRARGARPPS
jgi:beta-phosphoglucomutase-like phosphatase (HAD superfamily)